MSFKLEKCCLRNTRLGILKDIRVCIDNVGGVYDDKRIILLSGVAGSGKSAIAHSIAFHYVDIGVPVSSFFFSESNKQDSSPVNLIRNIARDLADKIPQYRTELCHTLESDLALCTTPSIARQFELFIEKPLKNITVEGLIVIVIDAFDECDKEGDGRGGCDLLFRLALE